MKMKEIGPERGCASLTPHPPLDPPLVASIKNSLNILLHFHQLFYQLRLCHQRTDSFESRIFVTFVNSPLAIHGTDWPVQMIE